MTDLRHSGPSSGDRLSSPRPRGFDRGQVTGGLLLIGVGAALLALQNNTELGRAVPLAIGVVLLVAFLATRQYGFLVPGGILSGVGSGILLVSDDPTGTRGPLFLLALGLGFISIWVLGLLFRVREHHWWPLIPGGILVTIGTLTVIGSEAAGILDSWPVVLIVIGVLVLGQAYTRRDRA
jgi:hypothetical protein